MKNDHVQNSQTAHRFLLMVCLAAVAATFAVARPQAAYADDEIVVPDVPVNLEVPAGHKVFLEGHAIGTQAYVCVRSDPDRIPLLDILRTAGDLVQRPRAANHHPLSEPQPGRGTTYLVRLGSTHVTPALYGPCRCRMPPSPVAPGAIPWLLLKVVGAEPGPTGGQRLTRTKYIQRLNTSGGIAPSIDRMYWRSARKSWCRTRPTISSTNPPSVSNRWAFQRITREKGRR